ncbi:MAG: hypothetical protein DMF63_11015 [Acidobacteria bacterium]|nr:MAG: hypothetical protein DMF63_11015 [Acidobacteriota bacterium]
MSVVIFTGIVTRSVGTFTTSTSVFGSEFVTGVFVSDERRVVPLSEYPVVRPDCALILNIPATSIAATDEILFISNGCSISPARPKRGEFFAGG